MEDSSDEDEEDSDEAADQVPNDSIMSDSVTLSQQNIKTPLADNHQLTMQKFDIGSKPQTSNGKGANDHIKVEVGGINEDEFNNGNNNRYAN